MSLVVASDWHHLENRKLEAVRACQDFDEERLLSLLDSWLTYEGKRGALTSPKTRSSYATGIRRFLAWCRPDPEQSPRAPLLRVTKADLQLFTAELLQEGLAPASVSLYLSAVTALYGALRWADAMKEDPTANVRRPVDARPRHERRSPVPVDGFKLMLELAEHPRDKALLHLLGSCGLRIGEVEALDMTDVAGGVVKVRRGKGSKSRTLPMPPVALQAVSEWLKVRTSADGEPALFVNLARAKTKSELVGKRMSTGTIRRVFKELVRAAGLDESLSPHAARHTALTRIYRATKDLGVTSRIAGHSSIDTTSIYAKMDLQSLQDAMNLID